jgi:hypothetical protein
MFSLDQVVPWGRSFEEYRRMFALDESDLATTVLGCADGPASFNADATRLGTDVVSCDPLYRCTALEIRARIAVTSTEVLQQTSRNAHEFVWDLIASVDELGRLRHAAMDTFLRDYPTGRSEGRYVAGSLPALPFVSEAFALALCSHFLFLYTGQTTLEFHVAAVEELCRVAGEVRIFPLLALGGQRSPYVSSVERHMTGRGYGVSIERVPYEFQRGGNQMLRIRRHPATHRSP